MIYNFDEVIDRSNNNSAKYEETEAKFGKKDLIPMWIADMDFKTAEPIIDALKSKAEQGIFGYTNRPDSYFDSVCSWLKKRHGWNVKSDWMIHTPGVVPALSLIVKELTEKGDKIIVQPPVYYPFFRVVKDHGRELIFNPLKKTGSTYVMDYDDLEKKAKSGAKMLILCNPHNPIGRVWTKEELTKLGNICLKYNIKVVSDEIHSDIIMKGNKHTPFASISDEFCKNSITCIAPSKTFNLAGLQAAVIIMPDENDRKKIEDILGVLDIKRNNCFSVVATEAGYRYGEEWLEQLLKYINGNIEFVNEYCKKYIPNIKPNKAEGTYFVWLDCRELHMNKKELHDFMINKAGIAFDDGYWFGIGGDGYMRMNAACPMSVIRKSLERLKKAVETI